MSDDGLTKTLLRTVSPVDGLMIVVGLLVLVTGERLGAGLQAKGPVQIERRGACESTLRITSRSTSRTQSWALRVRVSVISSNGGK